MADDTRSIFNATWTQTIQTIAWAVMWAVIVFSLAWCEVRKRELATVDAAEIIADEIMERVDARLSHG